MSDMLHSVINKARDDFKNSINDTIESKFALLESKIRDSQNFENPANLKYLQDYIKKEIGSLKDTNTNVYESGLLSIKNELMTFISSHLTKKDEMQVPTGHNISDNLVIERIEPEEPVFSPLEVGDTTYWLDSDYKVYKETEEGYEEINGTYDPETGELELEDEEDDDDEAEEDACEEDACEEDEEDEEEEEAVETEEFTYKNKTYYRDSSNNVYNAEGDTIGIWTGSVVKFIIKTA
jgi:hypothetical protein